MYCNYCKTEKDPSDYYLKSNGKRTNAKCKSCHKAIEKARYYATKGSNLKKWRAENAELVAKQAERANAIRRHRTATDATYREEQNRQKRESAKRNFIQVMFNRAKTRATDKGLEFSLQVSDIIVPEVCPILNVRLELGVKGNYTFTPTLDRVDVTKGYTKENTRVISMLANSMKNAATRDQLEVFAANILKYMDNMI